MKKSRIIFRADGNLVAGYGHVIRSLSLASLLKSKYKIVFIIQEPDLFLRTQIKNTCDEIIEIPVSKNLISESKKIAKELLEPNDIVVLDGYNFDTDYQTRIKNHCFKLVCIDDIYKVHFVADVIINHSEGIKKKNYSISKFSKLYLGSQYAMLRKSFLTKRTSPHLDINANHTVFINMGGTDQQNFTQKALLSCIKNNTIKKVDIVVGSYYPYKLELEKIIRDNKNLSIRIHTNLSEKTIASLMKKSTAAICSASTISYEYACVGGLLFVYKTVSNQKNIYSFLIKSKIAYPLQALGATLNAFRNKEVAKTYFKNRSNYFPGNSKSNLISIVERLEKERGITMRLANGSDSLIYFKWANDAEVRKNSVTSSAIMIGDHQSWFTNKLKSKNSRLYIFEKNGTPLGQVRLDKESNISEIDYSVGKKYRGQGYGEIILKNALIKYLHQFPNLTIIAKAKESNIASNNVFGKLGFKKITSTVIGGEKYSRYITSNA